MQRSEKKNGQNECPSKIIEHTHLGEMITPICYPLDMPSEIVIENVYGEYLYVLRDYSGRPKSCKESGSVNKGD